MAIDLTFSPDKPNNPFEVARRALITALVEIPVPGAITHFPLADEFEAVRDHIRDASQLFDAWLADIGHQIKANAPARVDMSQFDGAFTAAIDGNATYECDQAAELVREDAREAA